MKLVAKNNDLVKEPAVDCCKVGDVLDFQEKKNIRSAFSYIADKHSLSPNIVLYIYIDSKEIQYGPLSTIIVTISIYLSVTIFTNKNIVYYRFALLFSPRMIFRKVRFCVFFIFMCVYTMVVCCCCRRSPVV